MKKNKTVLTFDSEIKNPTINKRLLEAITLLNTKYKKSVVGFAPILKSRQQHITNAG